jgi:hypothetical protein
MVNYNALELGKILGGNIKKTDSYRDDFIENEELLDLLLGNLEGVNVSGKLVVTKNLFGSTALVWNHSVQGDLNVFEWNADYTGSEELVNIDL